MSPCSTTLIERLRSDPGDIDGCAAVERACFRAETVDFASELGRAHARVWVARAGPGLPVHGFLVAWLVAGELEIIEVATLPTMRRGGTGRALVLAAVDEARAVHAARVLLEVRSANAAAIALYRSIGFHAVGKRRGYYADTGDDALLMDLSLNPSSGAVLPHDDASYTKG